MLMSDASIKPDPYAPWRSRDYRRYTYSWFGMMFSKQIETLAASVYFVNIYSRAECCWPWAPWVWCRRCR